MLKSVPAAVDLVRMEAFKLEPGNRCLSTRPCAHRYGAMIAEATLLKVVPAVGLVRMEAFKLELGNRCFSTRPCARARMWCNERNAKRRVALSNAGINCITHHQKQGTRVRCAGHSRINL